MTATKSSVRSGKIDVRIYDTKDAIGIAAAALGADSIRKAIAERREASIILASAASQFEMLANLVIQPDIAWNCVNVFHLDEYVGLSMEHPASFRRFLWERFASRLPIPLRALHLIEGEGDVGAECKRLGQILHQHAIDVAFMGIGENSHLAFNDPPADFETDVPYLFVSLDSDCRKQQLGEGWFATLDAVPTHAISMSIKSIMRSRQIICTVPDSRKAEAVRKTLHGSVTPNVPASILQLHNDVTMFLDHPSASRLSND